MGQTSKALKFHSLTWPEKIKVMSNIHIRDLLRLYLPRQCKTSKLVVLGLWDNFSKTSEQLHEVYVKEFERDARSWIQDFIAVYHVNNITPYMHVMANHVPEFLKIHRSILPFKQQGLEKYNDVMMKTY